MDNVRGMLEIVFYVRMPQGSRRIVIARRHYISLEEAGQHKAEWLRDNAAYAKEQEALMQDVVFQWSACIIL